MKTRLAILATATMCAGMGVAGGALAGIPPLNTFPFDHQIGHTPPVQHGNGTSAPSNFTTTIHDRASTPCDDADVADILRGKRGAPAPTLVLPYLNQRVALRGSVICPGSGSRLMPEPDDVFPIRRGAIDSPLRKRGMHLTVRKRTAVNPRRRNNMNPCKACMRLNGQHSETRPHGDLRLEGTGVFGTPREPIRRYVQYRCHTCGSWLRQNTERGDPAGLWSLQDPSGRASATRDETIKDEHAGRAVEWLKNTIESAKGTG